MASPGASAEYPKRPGHFAHKFCRLLAKATVANEVGADVCWLLTVIAHTEDARGYRGAVTYHNGQLMSFCGFGSEDKLTRCRKKAVEAGWLHHTPGARGVAARYWVLVPDVHRGKDDLPSDERPDKYGAGQPAQPESQHPAGAGESAVDVRGNPRSMCGTSAGESAVNVRDSSSLHLHPHQDPPNPPPAGGGRSRPAVPEELRAAVAEVTGVDPRTAGRKLGAAAAALARADPPYTPAEVRAFGRRFWEFCPWAAKQRRPRPTPKELAERIGLVRTSGGPAAAPATTDERQRRAAEQQAARERDAAAARAAAPGAREAMDRLRSRLAGDLTPPAE